MNLRKQLRYLAGLTCLSIAIVSCDNVDETDRYVELPDVTIERNVLLVDFTGQNCVNCPEAHEKIEALEEQYGRDQLVAVSLHGGPMAIDTDKTDFNRGRVGLKTTSGDDITNSFGVTSFPQGLVDLTGNLLGIDQWAGAVYNAFQKSTDVSIEANAIYTPKIEGDNTENGSIKISANVKAQEDHNKAYVQFWIIEDGIKAVQRMADGSDNQNYIHNNVFRANLFNQPGKEVELKDGINTTIEETVNCIYNDKVRWNPENLYVLVYVYYPDNGVQQVERIKVVTE